MWCPIEFSPVQHQVCNLPVAQSLREATGLPNVITYRHRFTEKWVVALQSCEKGRMVEVGYINDASDGDSKDPTRADFERLTRALTEFVPKEAVKKKMRSEQKAYWQTRQEEEDIFLRGVRGLHDYIYKCRGPVAAERYLKNAGMSLRTLKTSRA